MPSFKLFAGIWYLLGSCSQMQTFHIYVMPHEIGVENKTLNVNRSNVVRRSLYISIRFQNSKMQEGMLRY